MPNSGANPGDSNTMLAVTIDLLSGADAVSGSVEDAPLAATRLFARGAAGPVREHPGCTGDAATERAKHLRELLPAADALLKTVQRALRAGATTAHEIRDMQRLELWLARLVVEAAECGVPLPAAKERAE